MVATTGGGGRLCRSYPLDRADKAEHKGRDVARLFLGELSHGGCVDEYTLDQLVIWASLAEGESRIVCGPPSLHATTAVDIVRKFFPDIDIEFHLSDAGVWSFRVVGIGFKHSC